METNDLALQLANIIAGYDDRPVLRALSMEVCRGEIVGIAGPNGAGKTTLLRVVMGLLVPIQGEVHLFGRLIHDGRQRRLIRRRIGYVAQEPATGALPITVYDAILLGLWGRSFAGWRRPGAEDRRAVLDWIERVGLSDKVQSDLRELSGGQRQRVALARALIGAPSLLILDEPTTHLDSQARTELIRLILQLHGDLKLTTLLVTHEREILRTSTDRTLNMENGQFACEQEYASCVSRRSHHV